MGCCDSSPANGSQRISKGFQLFDKTSKFLEDNHLKHAAIIAKGPLLPLYGNGERPKAPEHLPRSAFRLYDMEGRETEFRFETDGIFSLPGPGMGSRVFYNEIYETKFTPIPAYENIYSQMTFRTKVGFRTFFFFPREYESLVVQIIKSNA
jgi:hypothetical protein